MGIRHARLSETRVRSAKQLSSTLVKPESQKSTPGRKAWGLLFGAEILGFSPDFGSATRVTLALFRNFSRKEFVSTLGLTYVRSRSDITQT
jgi:hypothetical protein